MNHLKLPPQNIEAEEAVLGAILIEKDSFPLCRTILNADAFYSEKNKAIYLACERLFSCGSVIDLLTVSTSLRAEKVGKNTANETMLDYIGGLPFISSLLDRVSSSANLEFHCRIIQECWMRRTIIHVSSLNIERSYDQSFDILDLLTKSQLQLGRVSEKLSIRKSSSINEVAREILLTIDERDSFESVPTSIQKLDEFCRFSKGELIIIAGRPAMGKTSIAVQILLNTIKSGHRGLFFSMEMPEKAIVQKILSAESGIETWKIREKKLNTYEVQNLHRTYENLIGSQTNSMIDDSAGITIEEIRAKAVTEHLKSPLSVIIVDYVQFIKGSEGGSRELQVAHISRNLKYLAKEMKVPVIALAQLSRNVESRQDKRPQLSDLRESGSIEQDADMVIFPFRPEYYGFETDAQGNSTAGKCELIIEKNRHGGTGSIIIDCDMATNKFW